MEKENQSYVLRAYEKFEEGKVYPGVLIMAEGASEYTAKITAILESAKTEDIGLIIYAMHNIKKMAEKTFPGSADVCALAESLLSTRIVVYPKIEREEEK